MVRVCDEHGAGACAEHHQDGLARIRACLGQPSHSCLPTANVKPPLVPRKWGVSQVLHPLKSWRLADPMELFQRILSAPPLARQQGAGCAPQGPAPRPPLPTQARDSLELLAVCLPTGAFDRVDFGRNKDLFFRSDIFIEILCIRSVYSFT